MNRPIDMCGSTDRVAHHQVADAQVAERILDQQVAILCRGRLEQEPADEGEPRTAQAP
jgi:hypothetical protein